MALVLVLAASFRFYGQNWDDGHYFHPDERFIATVMDGRLSIPALSDLHLLLDADTSPLNTRSLDENGQPQAFAYGSLPFLIGTALGELIGAVTGTDLTSYANVGQFGRTLTALVDLGTVLLVILFTRRAFGEATAIVAGLLTAASVVLIQLAHFYTVDTWVTFFTMATLYACLPVMQSFSLRWSLVTAALGGAALATKVSVGVLGIPILVAFWLGARAVNENWLDTVRAFFTRLAVSAVPTLLVFAIFEPYAIWRPGPFIDDIRLQWEIVNGHFDIPFTRQFVGTISGLSEIENLILWGVAPGFGVAALIATFIAIYRAVTTRDPRYLLLIAWIIPYFYVIASSEARFLRYAAPLVPPLAILVGHELTAWWYRSGQHHTRRPYPGLAIATVVGITIVWAFMFMTVYTGTHPRVAASEWIYQNVPPGSVITHEIWDDRLPVDLGSTSGNIYQYHGLDLYSDRPNPEAVAFIADFLNDADIIVLSSQRLSHSIPRLPWRYPVQSEYYRLLEEEKLGYELAFEATNFPGFGDFRINTLGADESFSVYDHPPVRVFRKVDTLTPDEIELRFARATAQPQIPLRQPPEPTLRLDAPVQERSVSPAPGWSKVLTGFTPVAIVVWLVALGFLSVLTLPITLRLFPAFPDIGVGFSPLIGLLAVGIITWLIWSYQIAEFTFWTVLISIFIVGVLSWGVGRKNVDWRIVYRERRALLLGSLLTFVAYFSFFLLIRAINPDLWHPFYGGEKPMDTAYLNAIARTGAFPPHDSWFSDGWINYYYYGFFLLTILWTLTGIQPDIAYQLSLATIAGVFASGLFSLGATLTRSVLHTRRERWHIAGGVAAALIVLLTGNLHTAFQVVRSGSLKVNFWDSSRVVDFAINEFPYFTLLYGDVHAHLIAAPMLVLIVALSYSWIERSWQWSVQNILLWAFTAAVALGSITAINIWDGPTAGIILIAALIVPLLRNADLNARRAVLSAAVAGFVPTAAYLMFLPFLENFVTPTGGLETTQEGTAVSDWATHFGGLLIPIALFAIVGFYQLITGHLTRRNILYRLLLIFAPFAVLAGLLAPFRPVAAISLILVGVFITLYMANPNRSASAILAISGAAATGLILIADLFLIADHLRDSDWERMNTVFKLYFQSWTLLGIVAAAATIWLIHRAAIWVRGHADRFRIALSARPALIIGASFLALSIIFAWLAYPMLATADRLGHQMESSPSGLSLAGYEWMNGGTIQNQAGDTIDFTGDYDAIAWLIEEVGGNPVVLEASIGPYRGGGSRMSSATGMPAVLGWDSHQSQQRGAADVSPRVQDVRELYQTDDINRKRYLLRRYGVDYIVVGDVERFTIVGEPQAGEPPEYYASEAGLNAFQAMVGQDLELAFESHGTTIYRVLPFPSVGESE